MKGKWASTYEYHISHMSSTENVSVDNSSGYTHIFMIDYNISQSQWNPGMLGMRISAKSVPSQEHRFQMVLDGIVYSKTPFETGSLWRIHQKN